MLIGITGQIASGKSEVAGIFKKYGAFIISADRIGKDVVNKNPALLRRLVRAFGHDILTPAGHLRRKRLAQKAFADKSSTKILNRIVHPTLLRELEKQTEAALQRYHLVVIDAALLLDWRWDKRVDLTIVVHATDKNKLRHVETKGYSHIEAKSRLNSQMTFAQYRERADIVILNNSSLEILEKKVRKIIDKLT